MLKGIVEQLDNIISEFNNQFIVGKIDSYNISTGLARVQSLNFDFGESVYLDNVVVLNHGNLYENPVAGLFDQPNQANQHIMVMNQGELVLLLRISEHIYILLGTLNALRNIP